MTRIRRPTGVPVMIGNMKGTGSEPLAEHPVVRLLSTYPEYVALARTWAFKVQGATNVPEDGENWPPRYATKMEWIGAFWHWNTMRPWRENENRIPSEFASIEAWLEYSLVTEGISVD